MLVRSTAISLRCALNRPWWSVGLACVVAAALTGADAGVPIPAPHATATVAADALVREADAAVAAGTWDHARRLYAQALLQDQAHAGALAGLARVQAIQTGTGDRGAVDVAVVQQQLRVVEAGAAVARAELLARQGQPEAARSALDQARGLLVGIDARTDVSADVDRIARLIQELQPQVGVTAQQEAAAQRADARASAEAEVIARDQRVHTVFAERIERVRAQQRRLLLEIALNEARALTRDFPGESAAEALYEEILTQVHRQRTADITELRDDRLREVHRRIEESLIPVGWDAQPIYPIDWLERHHDTLVFNGASAAVEPWEEQLADRLAQRVSLIFEEVPIDEALAVLAKQGQFNLVVDPTVYATGSLPITLRVTDMRIDSLLNWLAQMSTKTWVLNKGAVYFGGETDQARVLAVYDIAAIVRAPYDQPGYTIGFSAAGASGGGQGGGFSLFEPAADSGTALAPEDVVDLIQQSVSPATWDDASNAIEIRANQLYITAPRRVHGLIQEFIRSQANANALAVHVAARWLTINDTALEEIGVNWGASQNLISAGGLVPPPGATGSNATSTWTANALHRLPSVSVPIQPATDGTGLNLSFLRLGNPQISAVFTAVERKAQSRILARPELITLNGVRGNVFTGTQYAYIADYEVVNNNLDPVIEVLTIGASLDIKPYISADRKYVTMEFRPALASVSFFVELITAPRIIGNGEAGVVVLDLSFPIELPNVRLDEVSTTVQIPDGGGLVVGGFQNITDEAVSSKVPFLGHIPFLGRLFGVRGRYHQREKIFLLAHVRIIDYQEAEDHL